MNSYPTNDIIKKQSNDYSLVATSFHESGHAIVGFYNFWYIESVGILNKPHFNEGQALYFDHNTDLINNENLIKTFISFDLQATAAGLVAEKMYYKDITGSDKFPMHLKIGSSDDLKHISKQIRKYNLAKPGEETNQLKKQIAKEAHGILSNNWEAVRQVSHRLYNKKTLSFDELKYILTRKTDQKEFWKDRFKKINIIHAGDPPDEFIIRKLIK